MNPTTHQIQLDRILYMDQKDDSPTHRAPYPLNFPIGEDKESIRKRIQSTRYSDPFYYDTDTFTMAMEDRFLRWRPSSSSHFSGDALNGVHPYQLDCQDRQLDDITTVKLVTPTTLVDKNDSLMKELESMYNDSTIRLILSLQRKELQGDDQNEEDVAENGSTAEDSLNILSEYCFKKSEYGSQLPPIDVTSAMIIPATPMNIYETEITKKPHTGSRGAHGFVFDK
ncbi:hypothetical protein FOA43_000185 [Brettanomyces nanus]|uniref:Uncharacterized protein n=1 Tax=Eeniella nana TaxID=13502 RepID=A0A875RY95_EENNA|nr:uncharacterized protein FOA43_000185 [Brettanomyces nanus]QPG72882.1 hypothetical protein FOA43_000185 [Brettanomyces nanus]